MNNTLNMPPTYRYLDRLEEKPRKKFRYIHEK